MQRLYVIVLSAVFICFCTACGKSGIKPTRQDPVTVSIVNKESGSGGYILKEPEALNDTEDTKPKEDATPTLSAASETNLDHLLDEIMEETNEE